MCKKQEKIIRKSVWILRTEIFPYLDFPFPKGDLLAERQLIGSSLERKYLIEVLSDLFYLLSKRNKGDPKLKTVMRLLDCIRSNKIPK